MSETYAATIDAAFRRSDAQLRAVLHAAAQDVADNVSVGGRFSPGTPRDVGFAWNNWVADLRGGQTSTIQPPKGLEGPVLTGTTSEMALVIASADLADEITIANPVEYVIFLETGETQPIAFKDGGDREYRAHWIEETAHQWPIIVQQAAQRVAAAAR